ncbi:glycosyl hydrolase [Bacteroidota bacterium]
MHNLHRYYSLLIIFFIFLCYRSQAQSRNDILYYFREVVKQEKIIVGQHCRDGERIVDGGYDDLVLKLRDKTGKLVSLIGADLGWQADVDMMRIARKLNDHWKLGGLVTVNWHALNPWAGGVRDMEIGGTNGDELKELLTPGHPAYMYWRKELDKVASALQYLRDNEVIVLWRPLHEMNGDWFWWCGRDKDEYIALWRDMYNYFTNTKGLDNLIWIYSPNAVLPDSKLKNVMYYYPGDNYVDIVGEDIYNDEPVTSGYEQYMKEAPGKIYVVGEFGANDQRGTLENTIVIDAFKGKAAYYLQWHGWRGNRVAIIENPGTRELMNHKDIITLDELRIKR